MTWIDLLVWFFHMPTHIFWAEYRQMFSWLDPGCFFFPTLNFNCCLSWDSPLELLHLLKANTGSYEHQATCAISWVEKVKVFSSSFLCYCLIFAILILPSFYQFSTNDAELVFAGIISSEEKQESWSLGCIINWPFFLWDSETWKGR